MANTRPKLHLVSNLTLTASRKADTYHYQSARSKTDRFCEVYGIRNV